MHYGSSSKEDHESKASKDVVGSISSSSKSESPKLPKNQSSSIIDVEEDDRWMIQDNVDCFIQVPYDNMVTIVDDSKSHVATAPSSTMILDANVATTSSSTMPLEPSTSSLPTSSSTIPDAAVGVLANQLNRVVFIPFAMASSSTMPLEASTSSSTTPDTAVSGVLANQLKRVVLTEEQR